MQGLMHYSIFIDIFTLASKIRGQKQIPQKNQNTRLPRVQFLYIYIYIYIYIYNINSLLVLGNRVRQYGQIQS